ncbi:DUF3226 domain-containing protein [Pseudomonas mandelii]|uniref:DUF4276 family protein n=1 Tax=Pseudomonas mandelii TaxID=75612 RepID=A0ABY0VQZ0_9PSED|nr:DUF3226 domain-containing protein [Pseudomonas mandelii]TWS09196.1 hypothetical protein FJD35_18045 [Pseudomonas mandelii]SDU50098.1 hypothetical protein SAMN04489801_3706 [Pseudomonas mandelii]
MKALMIFCEGPHDVAFVKKIMESIFSFQRVAWKFSEYPSPFNQLFKSSVDKHAARDMALDMAHKFFLPDQVFKRNNDLVLLFNSGGKEQIAKIKELLSDVVPMLNNASVFLQGATEFVSETKYLFFYDADDIGAARVRSEAFAAFEEVIEGERWMLSPWDQDTSNPFAAISDNKAIYIWGETPERGTLEDLLHPIFAVENSECIERAEHYIDGAFSWDLGSGELKRSVAEIARRKKAIITAIGQRKKPGSSMNVVLEQAKLISNQTLRESRSVNDLVVFIEKFAQFE